MAAYAVFRSRTQGNRWDGVSYDVVHLGPTVVAKGIKETEADALAKALNEEHYKRVNHAE